MRIALTGGIGAGKSTVSAYLQQLGAVVVDYDAISRDLTAAGVNHLRTLHGHAVAASSRVCAE